MNEEEIQTARRYKKYFLVLFYLELIILLVSLWAMISRSTDNPTMGSLVNRPLFTGSISRIISIILGIAHLIFTIGITWKFCRSIKIGRVVSLINSVFSPLFLLVQTFILLNIYSKRTGIGVDYVLADNPGSKSRAPLVLLPVGIVSFVFLTLPLIFFCLSFSNPDIQPIDDSDFSISPRVISEPENAFYDLIKSSNSLNLSKDESQEIDDYLVGKKWDLNQIQNLLSKNRNVISSYLSASNKPHFQDPEFMHFDEATSSSSFHILKVSRIVCLKAMTLIQEGKAREGINLISSVLRLSQRIQDSEVSVIDYTLGLASMSAGLKTINSIKVSKLDGDSLNRLVNFVSDLKVETSGCKSALKENYLSMKRNFQKDWLVHSGEPKSKSEYFLWKIAFSLPYFYKPNLTQKTMADFFRDRIADLYKPYNQIPVRDYKEFISHYNLNILPKNNGLDNFVGKVLLTIGLPQYALQQAIFDTRALLALTQTRLAILAYSKQKNRLPKGLQELVASGISTVPLDPFDQKPIRYSKEKKIVYSVGKNLTDVGGSDGDNLKIMDDPTLKIFR